MIVKFLKHFKWRLQVFFYDVLRFMLSPLPLAWISAFGGFILQRIGPHTRVHHIVMTNIKMVFAQESVEYQHQIALNAWHNLGRSFVEFPFIHRFNVLGDKAHLSVTGLEHLINIKTNQQTAVIVTGHFANWEIMSTLLARLGLRVYITYRPSNNIYFDNRICAQRRAYGTSLLMPKSGVKGARELRAALQNGHSIAILNDQKFNQGLDIDFFGQAAKTTPGAVKLAHSTQRPIIFTTIRRIKGISFHMDIHPPLRPNDYIKPPMHIQKGNEYASLSPKNTLVYDGLYTLTKRIETHIKTNPYDWFWVHRRWAKELYKKKTE